LLTARRGSYNVLERQCCTFIGKNVGQVMKTEGWAEMSKNHPELFQIIFEKMASAQSEQK
jgi:hypothetical protein